MPNYPGGILVIDELDAGFHPHAQTQILQELKREAKRLNLQIVATTHSLIMLEEAYREIQRVPNPAHRLDGIVYLQGGNPVELLDATDYPAIEADMHLAIPKPKDQQVVKVYVEDDEAALFLDAILTPARLRTLAKRIDRKIKIISARVGCSNLVGLVKADDYFKTVVVVLDADTSNVSGGGAKNIIRLPADARVTTKQSPEAIIESMCKAMVADANAYPETRRSFKKLGVSTDHVQAKILNLQDNETHSDKTVSSDRDFAKRWFTQRRESISDLGLVKGWIADNADSCSKFLVQLETAIGLVSGLPKASSKTDSKKA